MTTGLQFAMTGRWLADWRLVGLLCGGWACVTLVAQALGGGDPVCGPDTGSCFVAHQNPGCELVPCCELVCGTDPFCCQDEWDLTCVEGAEKQCDTSLTCPGSEDCHAAHETPVQTVGTSGKLSRMGTGTPFLGHLVNSGAAAIRP